MTNQRMAISVGLIGLGFELAAGASIVIWPDVTRILLWIGIALMVAPLCAWGVSAIRRQDFLALDYFKSRPIVWDFAGFLGSSRRDGELAYVACFWVRGLNRSKRSVVIRDAYIMSEISSEKIPVRLRTRQGYVNPGDANPVPGKCEFYMQGLFYDPMKPRKEGEREGMPSDLFLRDWSSFSFVVEFATKTYRHTFTRKSVLAQIELVAPNPESHPYITRRRAG